MLSKKFRISLEPGKTLLWLWLKDSLSKIKGIEGADLAGGSMFNKTFFKTKKYICVDINQIKLDEGKKRNPDAKVFNLTIQDYLKNNTESHDVLVCVQTMGTNGLFDHEETIKVVHQMYKALRKGGSMVFNVGSVGIDIEDMNKKLSQFFEGKFESIDKRFYGAFHFDTGKPRWKVNQGEVVRINEDNFNKKKSRFENIFFPLTHRLRVVFSLLVAFIMHFCSPLRTAFGRKKHKLFLCCRGKI